MPRVRLLGGGRELATYFGEEEASVASGRFIQLQFALGSGAGVDGAVAPGRRRVASVVAPVTA